jgi:hypothetical protein
VQIVSVLKSLGIGLVVLTHRPFYFFELDMRLAVIDKAQADTSRQAT